MEMGASQPTRAGSARAPAGAADLERRLIASEAELAAARSELEAFTYRVSHDLRSPLRAISGFAAILAEDYAADLHPPAQHYLELVQRSSREVGGMLDGLLAISRAGRAPLACREVHPAEVARTALAELGEAARGRAIEITIGELPPCAADPALLEQVFSSLLSNGLKFTRRCDTARIEVGYGNGRAPQGCGSHGAYFVRDNGVGFDPLHAGALFEVFARLHRVEEFEGTGVGLAIAQRIVSRHGGEIWAEGRPDQGATFYFTIGADA